MGVTISFPSDHQLAVSTEVESDKPLDRDEEVDAETIDKPSLTVGEKTMDKPSLTVGEEKEASVEFLSPTDSVDPVKQEDSVEENVEVEGNIDSVSEPREVTEDVGVEEITDETEGVDNEKHIYVATFESDYDVSEQLKAMNDVELAISEGFIEQDSYLHAVLS